MAAPSLHHWNTEFAWETPTGPYRALTDEQAAGFDRDGFVVIPQLVPADVIAEVAAEGDRLEAKTDEFLSALPDGRVSIAEKGAITFTAHPLVHSKILRDFSVRPELLDLCHDLVGPDVDMYWDQLVYKKPEKPRRFPWHQDNGYTFITPQQYLTIWVALSDATLENGCPQVAVGEHRRGTLAHHYVDPLGYECFEQPDDVQVAEVEAGGAVVFSSLTPHLTGPNTTDSVRKAYILQYSHAGSVAWRGEPGSEPTLEPNTNEGRQFPVLRGGQPVPA